MLFCPVYILCMQSCELMAPYPNFILVDTDNSLEPLKKGTFIIFPWAILERFGEKLWDIPFAMYLLVYTEWDIFTLL